MITDNNIYNLKLHEHVSITDYCDCRRVAGGWIYSYTDNFSRQAQYVYVPFSNEFQFPPDASQPPPPAASRLKSEIAAIADTLAHDIAKGVNTDRQALLNKLLQLSSV
jgi:hypothetical protein